MDRPRWKTFVEPASFRRPIHWRKRHKLGFERQACFGHLRPETKNYGPDPQFGKEAFRLSAIKTPPFYGSVKNCGLTLCTLDGIQVTDLQPYPPHRGRLRRRQRQTTRAPINLSAGRCAATAAGRQDACVSIPSLLSAASSEAALLRGNYRVRVRAKRKRRGATIADRAQRASLDSSHHGGENSRRPCGVG